MNKAASSVVIKYANFPLPSGKFRLKQSHISSLLAKFIVANKLSFNMSGQSDDEHLYDIELSETSDESSTDNTQENQDQSPEQAAVTESISTTGSYLAGTTPVGEVIPIPGLNSTEAPSSTINSGWTTEPTSSTQLASTSQPIESPAAGNKTYIHPISEGGSVTWKDHNEFVFHKGKDRGSRPPAPTLPADYKSKGPLPNFDFSKLRGNNVCMRSLFDSLTMQSFEIDKCNRLGRNQ